VAAQLAAEVVLPELGEPDIPSVVLQRSADEVTIEPWTDHFIVIDTVCIGADDRCWRGLCSTVNIDSIHLVTFFIALFECILVFKLSMSSARNNKQIVSLCKRTHQTNISLQYARGFMIRGDVTRACTEYDALVRTSDGLPLGQDGDGPLRHLLLVHHRRDL